jgi:hypothetical protein
MHPARARKLGVASGTGAVSGALFASGAKALTADAGDRT